MPPVSAEMLCSSPPLARATSSDAWVMRVLDEAPGIYLLMVSRISDELANGVWDVAFRAR
jgi:hypothetical protein